MRVGFAQLAPTFGRPAENLARIEALLGAADAPGADLWVLPELVTTGYQLADRAEAERLAEPADGESCQRLVRLARRLDCHLVYGFAERGGDSVYNACSLVGADGALGGYRKAHLFMREKELFDPGARPPPVLEVGGVHVGLMICFDWAFPEMARSLALGGAELIAHPANLVMPFCQAAMRTRCIENRVFAVTANRVGREARLQPELCFTGQSQICAPTGELLSHAGEREEQLGVAEIDPAAARDKRINPLNDVMADRRPELYRMR